MIPIKEVDIMSVEEDGRGMSIQYDRFTKCVKVTYFDQLTMDFIVITHEVNKCQENLR